MFSARIDPKTKDHLVDAQGRFEHDDSLSTSVYLALATERGSHTPDATFGSKLFLLRRQKLTTSVKTQLKQHVREALQHLVGDGRLQELTVTVDRDAVAGFLAFQVEAKDASGRLQRFPHRVQVGA